jgi:PAS domain S-box-containing protein
MHFDLQDFHKRHRSQIIEQWIVMLRALGKHYAQRPYQELYQTVSEAFDADYHFIVHNDYGPINHFINKITRIRLETGFLLSDVQNAFEQYRIIVLPLLAQETSTDTFYHIIEKINNCLAYTIYRFSDHFQNMHEKQILEHNQRLEEEVKARTAELRESELKYRTLVEEITDGYFVIQEKDIVFANQAFCQMHGYSLEEVIGKKYYDFVAPQDRKQVIAMHNRSFEKKAPPRSFEYMRLTKEQTQYPTEILARLTLYENKLSSIGICRDITERVKMEQRVREAERMAYIGQITTSLSHEIRNPLSAIKMNLQVLSKNLTFQGNDQRRLEISVKAVIQLENILKELLDFAKPLQLTFDQVNLNHVLSSCLEFLDMKFKEKELTLSQELEDPIPYIIADKNKLEQALSNLLLNAIEASYLHSEIIVKTQVRQNRIRSSVVLTVQDFGHGIREDQKEQIFRPFFTTKTKGTGLGLSNVKRIVEAHDGQVVVTNSHPHGARFIISLPLEKNYG